MKIYLIRRILHFEVAYVAMGAWRCVDMNVFSKKIIQMLSIRMKNYRIDYPMTQKQLAKKSGVSARSIQMFEIGKNKFCLGR